MPIISLLYFCFGFITNLNMALVPHLRIIFHSPYGLAAVPAFIFFLAYFVCSIPNAKLIEAIGYKRTMISALLVQALGALLLILSGWLLSIPMFLVASFVLGAGVTALQTSANPYVSILGPEEGAARRLTLAQAANAFGGMLAPIVAGATILSDNSSDPYVLIAGALAILAILVACSRLPEPPLVPSENHRQGGILRQPNTVFAAVGIFFYVGVEVALASVMVDYFTLHGVPTPQAASTLIAFYWGLSLVGRLIGASLLSRIPPGLLLATFATSACVLVLASAVSSGPVAVWTLIFCGLCNSIMFPNLFALGIAGLGPMTSRASGILMTAVVGGAVIPTLFVLLISAYGMKVAFCLPMACYLYIAVYGLKQRAGRTKFVSA